MKTSVLLFIAGLFAVFAFTGHSNTFAASDTYTVKRVIDGDTLLLDNGERVRLIGIDTPEVHKSKKLTKDADDLANAIIW